MTTHSPQPARPGHGLTVADAMDPCDYQIADDSTVDQADDVLRGAHLDYLLVRGHDGRCEGLVTRTGLHPFLTRSWYAERTAISSTTHQRGPFAWPTMGLALAAIAMRIKHLAVWPVVDEDGYILGALTADRAAGLLAPDLVVTVPA
ncbi:MULTISPECIES: CBS domain-containing protein [Kitasatospora]|uniref:CBS domain-containing protein n=1 Tax=Kitasatospora TaxID=2063 RepID=UPI0011C43618|nr:CBS domain-containing protein [Kitasatospora xanthocidica]